jgi:hypothetical protein
MKHPGFRFITDADGRKTGVILDLPKHRRIWEDLYDAVIAESRRTEPRVSWDGVKRRLNSKRRARA